MLKVVLMGSLLVLGTAAAWPVGGGPVAPSCCGTRTRVQAFDLSRFSGEPPASPVDLVFFHQGVGGRLLAEPGRDDGHWGTHPDGGGLRKRLIASQYRVHEATAGSKIGEHTELFDWLPKFRDHMPEVLSVGQQDTPLPEARHNRVVVWKSCYSNSYFLAEGTEPGRAEGPGLTLANAKASLRAMLPMFQRHPETLFVYLTTTPPLGHAASEPGLKWLAKRSIGWPTTADRVQTAGRLSRVFADWVVSRDGWLKDYPEHNVVVFDYYDLLTDHRTSDFLRYPTGGGLENYPNRVGQQKAAASLVPFLNRALHRAFGATGPAMAAGPARPTTQSVH